MKKNWVKWLCLFYLLATVQLWAAEPLVGTWQMTGQKLAGKTVPPLILALKVTESGGVLQFTYSLNHGRLVTMTFAARLNGSEVDAKDGTGAKIGTVQVTKLSGTEYKIMIKSPNKPPSPNKMTLSDGGKTLTCEADTEVSKRGMTHVVQVFTKQ